MRNSSSIWTCICSLLICHMRSGTGGWVWQLLQSALAANIFHMLGRRRKMMLISSTSKPKSFWHIHGEKWWHSNCLLETSVHDSNVFWDVSGPKGKKKSLLLTSAIKTNFNFLGGQQPWRTDLPGFQITAGQTAHFLEYKDFMCFCWKCYRKQKGSGKKERRGRERRRRKGKGKEKTFKQLANP